MASFSQLYEQYAGQVYRFLFSLSGDAALAEELTQETFYQAFLHIDRFENRCSVATWLCQIGKNAYFREQKRRRRQVSAEQAPPEGCAVDPEAAAIERDQVRRIRAHLAHLPEPYQTVFTLRVYQRADYGELARLYGKSESWARVTCWRAKEQLLARLKEEDGL